MNLGISRRVLVHCARTAIATVTSLLVARLFGLPEAYWAPITTVVITQSSLGAAFGVSWRRFVGTALGCALGAIVTTPFEPNVLVFGASIFILGLFCAIVRVDVSGYRFAGISVTIVLLGSHTESPWQIAFHRFAEVTIGIGVALVFATLWPEREWIIASKS